jgi:outer membrane receptor protein involved in Fe transport
VNDPCADAAPGSAIAARCGVAAGNGDPRSQLRSTIGGFQDLKPETAKVYTAGLVLQPRWVKNLTFTADYYNIAIDQAIGSLGEAVILQNCYATGQFCDRITRDPTTNFITNINNAFGNSGGWKTSGIDLSARYTLPTPVGRFGFLVDATWLRNLDITLPDGSLVRTRGNYDLSSQGNGGLGGVLPAWKFNAGANYGIGGFGAGVLMKFLGSWTECGDSAGDLSGSGICSAPDASGSRKVPAWTQWDLFGSYGFKSAAGRTSFGVGVNNVFNQEPARVYNGFQFNTDPTAYDVLGRFVYVRLTQSI